MKKLLIIDDDEDIRIIVRIILEGSGKYLVKVAASAKEGMEALREEMTEILLLDYVLPDTRGLELLKEIRKIAPVGTAVVILTARKDPVLEAEMVAAGALGVLHKPFNPDDLIPSLEALIGCH